MKAADQSLAPSQYRTGLTAPLDAAVSSICYQVRVDRGSLSGRFEGRMPRLLSPLALSKISLSEEPVVARARSCVGASLLDLGRDKGATYPCRRASSRTYQSGRVQDERSAPHDRRSLTIPCRQPSLRKTRRHSLAIVSIAWNLAPGPRNDKDRRRMAGQDDDAPSSEPLRGSQ